MASLQQVSCYRNPRKFISLFLGVVEIKAIKRRALSENLPCYPLIGAFATLIVNTIFGTLLLIFLKTIVVQRIKLIWEFYKSTIAIAWSVAFGTSLILYKHFTQVFLFSTITLGPFVSFLYKELAQKKEYYFYYNRGISKVQLILFTCLINLLIGTFLTLLFILA